MSPFSEHLGKPSVEQEYRRQWPDLPLRSGAVPYRLAAGGTVEILLIRRSGQNVWSIPKGQLSPFNSLVDTAAAEAFEEAGASGSLGHDPLGSFLHLKSRRGFLSQPRVVEVVVFPLAVETLALRWPEMGIRERQWFPQDEAQSHVAPGQLRNILEDFEAQPEVLVLADRYEMDG